MCGISLVISKKGHNIDSETLSKMNEVVNHRGPDSNSFYIRKNIGLGHTRLSILDLSNNGIQPMEKYNLVLTFNGEIYNYIELRSKLIQFGYDFTTYTDTEVILAAYHYWGKDCVTHFNGMWAFAIFDIVKNEVFISRDRFGVKPIYYYDEDDFFVIGSEIKQILPFLSIITADEQVVVDYIVAGMEDHLSRTFFKGVNKLPPSNSLVFSLKDNSLSKTKYFELSPNSDVWNSSEFENVSQYEISFKESIRLRLRSDVRVGTCLSGGLDSSAIAYFASKLHDSNDKFLAFHVSSTSDSRYSEISYVHELVKDLPIDLVVVDGSKENILNNINDVIKVQEEPFGSPSVVLQYLLMKKAKDMKCKVLLDGQGGDETLLGYERYYPSVYKSLKWSQKLKYLVEVVNKSNLSFLKLIKYLFYFTNPYLRVKYLKFRSRFIRSKFLDLISIDIYENMSLNFRNIVELQKQEIFSTQLPHLLRYEDKNSMYFGIETRLPFLDYNCVQIAISIRPTLKVKDGWSKFILRKSTETNLPKSIVWRRDKIGFELPEDEIITFIEPELIQLLGKSKLIGKIVKIGELKRLLPSLNSRIKWRLYNLVKWELFFNIETQNDEE